MRFRSSAFIQLAILNYVFFAFFVFSNGEMIFKISRVILFVAGLLYIVGTRHIKFNIYLICGLSFFCYHLLLICCGVAVSPTRSFEFLQTYFYSLLCNVLIVNYINYNNRFLWRILKFIPFAAFIEMMRVFCTYGFTYYLYDRGAALNGNLPGFKAAIGCLVAMYVYLVANREKMNKGNLTLSSFVYLMLAVINVVFVILTASRTAFLMLIVPYAVYKLVNVSNVVVLFRNIIVAVFIIIASLASIYYIPALYNLVGERLFSALSFLQGGVTDASTSTRMLLIQNGLMFFSEHPIMGYGLDGFRTQMGIHFSNVTSYYAHNNYIEILVSGGIVGFILYYLVEIKTFGLIKNIVSNRKSKNRFEAVGCICMLLCYLMTDFTSVNYYEVIPQLVIALIFSYASYLSKIEVK